MGCVGSRFDMVPVTGHPSGLAVIPAGNIGFLRSEPTVLKLREKILSWSGDDCSVKVLISLFINKFRKPKILITVYMYLRAHSITSLTRYWPFFDHLPIPGRHL